MGINRLWLKIAGVAALTAIAGIVVAALLIHNSTANDFNQYLRHISGMQGMMGGQGPNMMGVNETAYLDSVNRALWVAAVAAVALAALIAVLFSRQITAPLRRLSQAAGKVAQGDLTCRVGGGQSGDEVGALSQTFNCMVDSLAENQEARRKLIGDLAHEMGTPLAVIQSNLEGMLDGVVPPSRESISSLHQESLVLSRLVRDLRTLSQAEAGRLNLQIAPLDLGALASSIVTATQTDAERRGISLSQQIEANLPRASGDPDRVRQMISNLLSNALRYSSRGDSVRVQVSSRAAAEGATRELLVAVVDTGQGISREDLPHIFDRYYRGTQAKEKRVGGSGIGLTVVKELIDAHKGKIWVASEEGKGSTFYFTLPAL
jgi:signal transduction histidine kinase